MRFFLYSVVLPIYLTVILVTQAVAESRVALVIGNSEYSFSPLTNPVHDAIDMTAALKKRGFQVMSYTDLDRKQMRQAIREFGEKLKKSQVGLFYYAGHGIQIKGRNYLIPVTADISSADEVEDESIDAGSVLRKMETAGNPVNIMILDACRNNPFGRSFRNLEQGLARMDGPVGSLIAYSTSPGSVAADGNGRNGLYTQYLLKALQQPGLTIEQTFKQVRNFVRKETDGKQIPWESSSLTGEFVFYPVEKVASINPASPPPPPEYKQNKYLQVITNMPEATVLVNNIFRGVTDHNGILNISGLSDSSVEVIVKADDYGSQRKLVQLIPGQWQQVNIDLHPNKSRIPQAKAPVVVSETETKPKNHCPSPGKIIYTSEITFLPSDRKPKVVKKMPKLFGLLHRQLKQFQLELVKDEQPSNAFLSKINQFFNKNKSHPHYLLNIFLEGRELPIKIVRTQMKTIQGELVLELRSAETKQLLSSVSQTFKKPGMEIKSVVDKKIEQHLDRLLNKLFSEACHS